MDLNEFKSLLSNSRSDIWTVIDTALTLASTEEYSAELKRRRDGIVERLYSSSNHCRNCDGVVNGGGGEEEESPLSVHHQEEQLEDPHQSDDAVVDLLQTLADMDLTFKGLKETDIGRHVNRLRKHQSSEVRSLVKHLVRKWKDLVDEWVGSNNSNNEHQRASSLTDGDSPLLQNVPRKAQNGNQQGPDFGYSPNPHNWSESPSADRINTEEYRPKSVVPKRETPSRPVMQSSSSMVASASVPQSRPRKEQNIDPDRLASASKRLQENYQEAQNAKKQRTIQVMDIHEIPKPRNGFIAKNKGNFQGRHHR
ncbi:transcription elongation factor (TFIIS) family protein [Artemisia annua]|uniref:Transcription elongation factor (TFIIS) family protein n=1 Tax=Artemisia annua TaxID=35608 RepID=A0A2U1PD57_ARTAN|nr:transcription elongation factor (TFIIS) family protein [Artemisia annua]